MVNDMGKLLRKWRIDRGVTMREMAIGIGISTAFLSAIELSKKKASDDIVKKIITYFNLDESSINELKNAAYKSNGEIKLNLHSLKEEDQDGVLAFARKYSSLSNDKKEKIRRILGE